ncbi:MAG: cell wall hydrolase [Oscillospiraceae bacterium]|nr:cell wall hydrolase [Oscillospiraceae bacterium]
MSQSKKVICTLLAVLAFVLVTIIFTGIMQDAIAEKQAAAEMENRGSYHIPTAAATEPAPTETEPAETETTAATEETLPEETAAEETQPRTVYEEVPLYFQTDYPDILYRSGTLATSGSNIASLAMVATYLTGHEYRPDQLADYFADYIGNSMEWLEYASDALQLPWKKAENFHVAKQALREGKVVITLMNERSIFTQSQHFIVLTGLTEGERILVNDPYEPHYTQWNLKGGLASGFADNSIITGYAGSWIYDPAEMPEEPFIYEEEAIEVEFRYPGLELTQEDKDLLARLICGEGESEPFEGQQAIAEVVLNRLAADNFPDSVKSIVYAENQFKSADHLYAEEPTHIQYEAIERALYGPYVLPIDVVFFATYPVNDNVWGQIGTHTFCFQW